MNKITWENLKELDETELANVAELVGRRLIILRKNSRQAGFWYSALYQISKFLRADPNINTEEKSLILSYLNNGEKGDKLRAIRAFKTRTGNGLRNSSDLIEKWIRDESKYSKFDVFDSKLGVVLAHNVFALDEKDAIERMRHKYKNEIEAIKVSR